MQKKPCSEYDYMRRADSMEEDAYSPDEWVLERDLTDKEKYFDYYDDIKLTPKDDW